MFEQKRLLLCVSDHRQALTKVLSKLRAEANEISHMSKYRLVQITQVNQSNHNTVSQLGSSKLRTPSCSLTGKRA